MSFTFVSETGDVSSWTDLLIKVGSLMRERHPRYFERIFEIRGRTRTYFSESEGSVYDPRSIGSSGIYPDCLGPGLVMERRARQVVELFGYPPGSVTIQELNCQGGWGWMSRPQPLG